MATATLPSQTMSAREKERDRAEHPNAANLRAWWRQFTLVQRLKSKPPVTPPGAVFGVPLRDSLRYASVQISTANQNGELYVWGYIPVVVAKCGLFLKERGTEVEGIFRISGSSKRMRDLQTIFESPPRYGKNIQWNDEQARLFTPHDVASVFRRFLTQMPEPIIPHSLYHDFRNAYSKPNQPTPLGESNRATAVTGTPPPSTATPSTTTNSRRTQKEESELIATYKRLISQIPLANQYLLLYVLDLLTVFAKKGDINKMPATNLAVIFRPAVLNHPSHEMSPEHHKLSQEVLEFLIEKQDWFMLDIPPPPRQDSILTSSSAPHLPASSAKDNKNNKENTKATPDYLSNVHVAGVPSIDDVYVGPATDEDESGDGGWRLVGGASPAGGTIGRRRTFSERGSDTLKELKEEKTGRKSTDDGRSTPFRSAGNLSAVPEGSGEGQAPGAGAGTGIEKKITIDESSKAATAKEKRGRSSVKLWGTVKRSRTVDAPSSDRAGEGGSGRDRERGERDRTEPNVLRKRGSRGDVK